MPKLKRSLSAKMLTLYGLGNILGAGIYVLIGEVAAESGDALLWSFLLAAIVASFTAVTYSAMAGAYPVSAGAAVYSEKAFKKKWFSTAVGLAVASTAVVSSSALLRGFARFARELFDVSTAVTDHVFMIPLLLVLAFFALRGISQSARLAVVFTLLEAAGLVLIVILASANGSVADATSTSFSALGDASLLAIGLGGFLAFYAFVGFEDMVNVAEEVRQPNKTMRRGMLSALAAATVLYILVALASLAVLPSSDLAAAEAPLAAVFESATDSTWPVITMIGIIAITNGILIQIITSSRILYGLAKQGWLPKALGAVSKGRNVPQNATLLAVGGILIGSSLLPLGTLAQITSFILLLVFTVVHASALRLKSHGDLKRLHRFVPQAGIVLNLIVITLQILSWLDRLPEV